MCREYMSIAVKSFVKHLLQPVEKIKHQKYSFRTGIASLHMSSSSKIYEMHRQGTATCGISYLRNSLHQFSRLEWKARHNSLPSR